MNKRVPAIISTVSNSFCDFTLDIAVNKYNMYFILFGTALGSFVIQLIYGIINGVSVTFPSLIFIIANGICMLLGYALYVQTLKRLPVALTGLIESGSLFAYLLIDFVCGYLKINLWFLFLFTMFMLSIFIFSYDTYKQKDENKIKKIKMSGILILLCSMLFYGFEPYLIRFASDVGANEVAINFGYYFFAIPFFFIMMKKNKTKETKSNYSGSIKLIILISLFEAVYYLFGTMGYVNEAAVINAIIQEIRVFLLFILSIVFGTDKLSLNKIIAIIMGILSVIGIYLY